MNLKKSLAETGFGNHAGLGGGQSVSANRRETQSPERPARVTISDVAEALDITKSTVSRAMNGYADISESTQQRVKKMARQMNYQPLSHAQAIKTGRTRSLGLVLQLADHDAHRPFLAEFLAGVSAGASKEGYTLTLASADTDASVLESFRALLKDGKADGFILPRAMVDDLRVKTLCEMKVPFVLYGRQDRSEGCAWFDIRGEDAMRKAVAHLVSLGHTRIAFINGGSIYMYAKLRRQGFEQGIAECGLTLDRDLLADNSVTLEDGVIAAGHFLDLSTPPTALVCAVDQVALGAYRAARLRGLAVGRDVSIIGYDGIAEGGRAKPALTTFAVDSRAAGARLATLLIRRIRGEAPEALRETEEATFLDRGSTGPVKGNISLQ